MRWWWGSDRRRRADASQPAGTQADVPLGDAPDPVAPYPDAPEAPATPAPVQVTVLRNTAVLHPSASVVSPDDLADALAEASRLPVRLVVLDLRGVEALPEGAVAAFEVVGVGLARNGRSLMVVNAPAEVSRAVHTHGLADLVHVAVAPEQDV